LKQAPSQQVWPDSQGATQAPPQQIWSAAQLLPQTPQLAVVVGSAQTDPQQRPLWQSVSAAQLAPMASGVPQVPLKQTSPVAHGLLQAPQWLASVLRFVSQPSVRRSLLQSA
jgi:hypothetical protein